MGVLNTTPDSFSDGGLHIDPRAARERIDELLSAGAHIIDIGSESTRPGAAPVAADEQIARAEAAVKYATARGAIVSIDTTSPEVAEFALRHGARIINDVSCLADERLASVAKQFDAVLLLMHSRGSMAQMDGFSNYSDREYDDVVEDVKREWGAARDRAVARGLAGERIWFDPGLGFHKNAKQSGQILRGFEAFLPLQTLIAVGPSRKSFIGALDNSPPEARLGGTIAACLRAVSAGARIVRIHDVQPVGQALLAAKAFERPKGGAHA